MTGVPLIRHDHVPIYRVVRAGWADPIDAFFAKRTSNWWNSMNGHAVLYTCCSPQVARAIVHDVFQLANVALADLAPASRPVLVEIGWSGFVSDLAVFVEDCSVSPIVIQIRAGDDWLVDSPEPS